MLLVLCLVGSDAEFGTMTLHITIKGKPGSDEPTLCGHTLAELGEGHSATKGKAFRTNEVTCQTCRERYEGMLRDLTARTKTSHRARD